MINERSSAGAVAAPALVFCGVSFRYREETPLVLQGLDLALAPGEVVALVGGNGTGKSTIARLANGLLHPSAGRVLVDGLDPADADQAWQVRARVGLLFQDPEDQIVGATVEDDVAFGLENLGVPRPVMRERVAAILRTVGLEGEGSTEPHLLSGGQKQRLALAGVLVLTPRVLVLDEPTSMLDPDGRTDVMAAVRTLAADGVAVLLITQHMDEALGADRVVAVAEGAVGWEGPPAEFFAGGAYRRFPLGRPVAMQLVEELGGAFGAARPPLTEDELVAALAEELPPAGRGPAPAADAVDVIASSALPERSSSGARPVLAARLDGVAHTYNRGTPFARVGVAGVDFELEEGSITALVGPTAAGKSTVLQLVAGLLAADAGTVDVLGHRRPPPGAVGMVFQRPEAQLYAATVEEDVGMAPRLQQLPADEVSRRVTAALEAVDLDATLFAARSPFALSVGEQRRVALAGVLSMDPALLVLDEPGAGLDPPARRRLAQKLAEWAARRGRTLLFTSHDMEEVAALATRVAVMSRGRVVADGPVRRILGDARLLRSAGLRPPLPARVAERCGAGSDGPLPIDGPGLRDWLAAAGVQTAGRFPAGQDPQ